MNGYAGFYAEGYNLRQLLVFIHKKYLAQGLTKNVQLD